MKNSTSNKNKLLNCSLWGIFGHIFVKDRENEMTYTGSTSVKNRQGNSLPRIFITFVV